MKTYYTKNEIQRIATEKAIEILNKDKEMVLNNTSYGGRFNVLIGLTNTIQRWESGNQKEVFIVLDREDYCNSRTIELSIYECVNNEYKQIEIINKFYEIHTRKGVMYLTNEEDYKRHKERQANKYDEKRKDMIIKIDTLLNEKIKNRIQSETSKKIKEQEFTVTKSKHGYSVHYIYRNVKNIYIKEYQ